MTWSAPDARAVRALASVETVPITVAPRLLGPLHQQSSHAARRRVNQHDTAGTWPTEFVDQVVCRHTLLRTSRALLETKVVR